MKNKAVELMVRCQFNIPKETNVDVVFLDYDGALYSFEVEWYEAVDKRCQCNMRLPHLNMMTQQF